MVKRRERGPAGLRWVSGARAFTKCVSGGGGGLGPEAQGAGLLFPAQAGGREADRPALHFVSRTRGDGRAGPRGSAAEPRVPGGKETVPVPRAEKGQCLFSLGSE